MKKMNTMSYDIQMFIARLLIVGLFAMSAFGKVIMFQEQAGFAGSSWITQTLPFLTGELLLTIAIIMEVVGVISVLLGWNMQYGAYVLMLYTFLASVMFHIGDGEMTNFLKNVTVMGGLLVLSMMKQGKISIDEK
ncbi:MAG: DoxX family protein [Candidatus Nanoarchaeia archaeon]